MLVLTRRVGERLFIGDDIILIVLGAKGNQIRLGFQAPFQVNIVREEVALRAEAKETFEAIDTLYEELFEKDIQL